MMKFYIIAILIACVNAGVINRRSKCILIRSYPYDEEVLKTNVYNPYQLLIDYDTNVLFFSYTSRNTNTSETFDIAYLNLKNEDYGLVRGIRGGFANAIDRRAHVVYMGGEDGIYKYNYETDRATSLYTGSDLNVWQMFYKDQLYFTTFPEEKLYTYKDGEVKSVPELPNKVVNIAVQNDGNFLYSNSSGLFTYSKTEKTESKIGDYTVNSFSTDMNGVIHFTTPTGIYHMNDVSKEITQLGSLTNVYGAAIEGDGNIIYAAEESIIRLKPTTRDCFY